jgi:hypothetical protein
VPVQTAPGFPEFTNEVQHFLDKVLRWDDAMNSFRLKNTVRFPGLAKPGKQSATLRLLWIAVMFSSPHSVIRFLLVPLTLLSLSRSIRWS